MSQHIMVMKSSSRELFLELTNMQKCEEKFHRGKLVVGHSSDGAAIQGQECKNQNTSMCNSTTKRK